MSHNPYFPPREPLPPIETSPRTPIDTSPRTNAAPRSFRPPMRESPEKQTKPDSMSWESLKKVANTIHEEGKASPRGAGANAVRAKRAKVDTRHMQANAMGINSSALMKEAHDVFGSIDSDYSGSIDMQELEQVIKAAFHLLCMIRLEPRATDSSLCPAPKPLTLTSPPEMASPRPPVLSSRAQVRDLLKVVKSRHAPPDFADKLLFEEIDTDGNGSVDRVEWINFVAKQSHHYGERAMFKLLQTIRTQMDERWSLPC